MREEEIHKTRMSAMWTCVDVQGQEGVYCSMPQLQYTCKHQKAYSP